MHVLNVHNTYLYDDVKLWMPLSFSKFGFLPDDDGTSTELQKETCPQISQHFLPLSPSYTCAVTGTVLNLVLIPLLQKAFLEPPNLATSFPIKRLYFSSYFPT